MIVGAAPVASVVVAGSLPDETFVLELEAFDARTFLATWPGDTAWLLIARPWDPETGGLVDVFASTHGYVVLGDGVGEKRDTIAPVSDWTEFPAGMARPSGSFTMLSGASFMSGAVSDVQAIRVGDPDSEVFASWRRYSWRQREIELWVGPAMAHGPSFSSFYRFARTTSVDAAWAAGVMTITLSPSEAARSVVEQRRYWGTTGAIRIPTGEKVTAVSVTPYWSTGGISVEAGVRLRSARLHAIFHLEGNLGVYVAANGAVIADCQGTVIWTDAGAVEVGRHHRILVTATNEDISNPTGLSIWVDGSRLARLSTFSWVAPAAMVSSLSIGGI